MFTSCCFFQGDQHLQVQWFWCHLVCFLFLLLRKQYPNSSNSSEFFVPRLGRRGRLCRSSQAPRCQGSSQRWGLRCSPCDWETASALWWELAASQVKW